MLNRRFRVHFRHHQGDVVIHAEGTGVVHHHRSSSHDRFAPLPRHRAAGGSQHQIHTRERRLAHLLHREVLAIPGTPGSSRTGRRQQAQLLHREMALLQQLQQFLPHSTARTKDGHREWSIRQ